MLKQNTVSFFSVFLMTIWLLGCQNFWQNVVLDYLITFLQSPLGTPNLFANNFGQGCFVKGKCISHVRNVCFLYTPISTEKNPIRPAIVGSSHNMRFSEFIYSIYQNVQVWGEKCQPVKFLQLLFPFEFLYWERYWNPKSWYLFEIPYYCFYFKKLILSISKTETET